MGALKNGYELWLWLLIAGWWLTFFESSFQQRPTQWDDPPFSEMFLWRSSPCRTTTIPSLLVSLDTIKTSRENNNNNNSNNSNNNSNNGKTAEINEKSRESLKHEQHRFCNLYLSPEFQGLLLCWEKAWKIPDGMDSVPRITCDINCLEALILKPVLNQDNLSQTGGNIHSIYRTKASDFLSPPLEKSTPCFCWNIASKRGPEKRRHWNPTFSLKGARKGVDVYDPLIQTDTKKTFGSEE